MNKYQIAVQNHMETAPYALKEYVCEKLENNSSWIYNYNPIINCEFTWYNSIEKRVFWNCIAKKQWSEAINTEFWQNYLKDKRIEFKEKYKLAVFIHMERAPITLSDYVCNRLEPSDYWSDNYDCVVENCNFIWTGSEEGFDFWEFICESTWQDAIGTEFWQNYIQTTHLENLTYEQAVIKHMDSAPNNLKKYVINKLKNNDIWEKDTNPILNCGFNWKDSKEKISFWEKVSVKNWNAIVKNPYF